MSFGRMGRDFGRLGATGSRALPVFPGDSTTWGGVFGTRPMTLAVYLQSFISPVAAFDYQLWTGSAGSTGTINYVNGALDVATLRSLMGLFTDGVFGTSSLNPWYGTTQVRITKWYNEVSGGPHLVQADVTLAPILGLLGSRAVVIVGESSYMEVTTSSNKPTTDGFTVAAAVRPFNSYYDLGGAVIYTDLLSSGQGLALMNNQGVDGTDTTSCSRWASKNALVGIARAGLSSIRPVAVTMTQTRSEGNCEVGVGAQSTTYADFTGGSFTGGGYTLGRCNNGASLSNFFSGMYECFMFKGGGVGAWRSPAATASYRASIAQKFGYPAIVESKNILFSGGSNNTGYSGRGIPQIKQVTSPDTNGGPRSWGWPQAMSDAITKGYRTAICARPVASSAWTEFESRIADFLNFYSSGNTNIHYFNYIGGVPDANAAAYITSLQHYLNAFNTAATSAGQTWLHYIGGFTPVQSSPTNTSLNAALIANQAGPPAYTYVPPLGDSAYNTALAGATSGTDEWIAQDGHLSSAANVVIASAEGANFNSAVG